MSHKFPGGLIDIKFSKGQVYLLKEHKMTCKLIEMQLSQLKYTGQNRAKSIEIENMMFPPINLTFFQFIFLHCRLPNEEELINEYARTYFTSPNDNQYSYKPFGTERLLDKAAMDGRILRTYPSLIRDFHFYLMCYESGLFENISYSLERDYFKGIDIIVRYKGTDYCISLMVESERSTYFKSQKYERHDYSELKEILLKLNSKNCKMVSNFMLYPHESLNEMIQQMN